MAFLNIPQIYKKVVVVALMLIIVIVPIDTSAKRVTSEHKYMAKFLYNFMSHVHFSDNQANKINICIIGDNAITPHLSHLVRRQDSNLISVLPKYIDDNLNNCHVVYIDEVFKENEARALLKARNNKVLTIGNIKGFANRGGIVEFLLRKNKVELKINVSQMSRNKISISDTLLSISDTINTTE